MALTGKTYSWLVALALLLTLPFQASAQRLAVKTNVLSLAMATPDLGFELVTGEHMSLSISAYGTHNPYWRDLSAGEDMNTSLFVIQPEVRYWFNGRPLTRFFAGVDAMAVSYDFPLMEVVHKGNAAGAGLTAGYVFNITKRLDLEISTGAGALFYWGKRADTREGALPAEDGMPQTWGYKLMPNKIGISLVYIIK